MATRPRARRRTLLFRQVNERIAELLTQLGDSGREARLFVCECSRGDCVQTIELSLADFRGLTDVEAHALVAVGHENGANLVARRPRFVVVERG